MLILNFTHPFTAEQREQIQTLAAPISIEEIHTIPVQINQYEPLEAQITAIVNTTSLSSEEWQTCPLLINPPGYAPAAFVLLAELHGRIGHLVFRVITLEERGVRKEHSYDSHGCPRW